MKKIIIFKMAIVLGINFAYSQDIQLTQFFASPTIANPAFAGVNACSKFVIIHRNQWVSVNKAYRSYLASYDHFFTEKNFGMSVMVSSDVSGRGNLRNDFAGASFSYEAVINRKSSFRFAIQSGFSSKSLNLDKLYFGDQIVRGGGVKTIENQPLNRAYFDIGSGFLYTNRNFWVGGSFFHLNKPNESFYNNSVENLPMKYSFQTGIKILLNDEDNEKLQKNLYPVLIYKGQQKFDQVDIGIYFTQNVLNLGIWYRGIPLLKSYKPGYQNNDAIAFLAGVNLEKYKIGYSYDLTISQLTNATGGSHELTMSYQFCKAQKKKQKRKTNLVHCPKF